MCVLAGVSRAGYYRRVGAGRRARKRPAVRDRDPTVALANRRYGYRRIAAQLRCDRVCGEPQTRAAADAARQSAVSAPARSRTSVSLISVPSNWKSSRSLASGSLAMVSWYLIEHILVDLGGEQVADEALRLMLAFDGGGHDLIEAAFMP